VRTFEERSIVESFLFRGILDLEDEKQDVASYDALCLVGSESELTFKKYESI
jgi:hypothetical protein